ncbi:MAG: chorismate synthase [Spirochaetaceae bacterium]|jgi:chorismate synthase|nr:chorismate synthase [Spirochaetaceae bacterium]
MSGNSFGKIFRVTTFGESHGPATGCVIDGCPSGLPFTAEAVNRELARRRPGGGGAATLRREADECEILSGVFQGTTLGTPIAIIIRNTSQRSADYDVLKDVFRPGHADWCWETKFGLRDHNGGGRSSGRETAARVAAGALAKMLLAHFGIEIRAWTGAIAGIIAPEPQENGFDLQEAENNSLRIPCSKTAVIIEKHIEKLRKAGDSAGGIVICRAAGVPAGLGEPVFEKLDALISQAILSIGAAKSIEFGNGFNAAAASGYENNDTPIPAKDSVTFDGMPPVSFASNRAGGVLGGISTGMPLEFRVAFKPVPSVSKEQKTVDKNGHECSISIQGRHDICVCPRAVPVVEAMTALVLADLMLQRRCNRL